MCEYVDVALTSSKAHGEGSEEVLWRLSMARNLTMEGMDENESCTERFL